MNINKKLLEKQVKTLSKQLNKKLTPTERLHIEGLLNFLGDFAEMMKGPEEPAPKIVIQVDGGNISGIYANRDIKIVVIDNDNAEEGNGTGISEILEPDAISASLHELYIDNEPRTIEIRDELKRLKF